MLIVPFGVDLKGTDRLELTIHRIDHLDASPSLNQENPAIFQDLKGHGLIERALKNDRWSETIVVRLDAGIQIPIISEKRIGTHHETHRCEKEELVKPRAWG